MVEVRPKTIEELGIERKPFYAPAEVAKILGVSDQNVLDRIHAPIDDPRYLYAVNLGPRTYRIPFGALLQLVGIPVAVRVSKRPNLIDDGIKSELEAAKRKTRARDAAPAR